MKVLKYNYFVWLVLLLVGLRQTVSAQTRELKDLKDIAFAGGLKDWLGNDQDSLRCDFYYPTGALADKKYPVVLNCHAGSFTGGTKIGQTSNSDALADAGFIVVALDYRTGYNNNDSVCADDTAGQNAAIYRAAQDGNACMRFLYHYADSFNIDTGNMFVMGNSAGADLTLHMQYINDSVAKSKYPLIYAKEGSLQTSGNSFPDKYKVKALCVMWGGLPNWNLITPDKAVPTILYKGGQDPGLPEGVGNYKKCPNYEVLIAGIGIYKSMVAIGVPCVYHYNPLGYHAAYDEEFTVQSTACFLKPLCRASRPPAPTSITRVFVHNRITLIS